MTVQTIQDYWLMLRCDDAGTPKTHKCEFRMICQRHDTEHILTQSCCATISNSSIVATKQQTTRDSEFNAKAKLQTRRKPVSCRPRPKQDSAPNRSAPTASKTATARQVPTIDEMPRSRLNRLAQSQIRRD